MHKLYILPFDHRSSFIKTFGFSRETITEEKTELLKDYKHLIYEGFLFALDSGVPKEAAAILVDEEFGTKILEEARAAGITRILTTEKSGQDEFDFEYGDAFSEHIEKFKPDYVKALVHYNSDGDAELNKRQVARLKILNDFCMANGYKFLFELLIAPTAGELSRAGSTQEYEKNFHWDAMRRSIKELKSRGIYPDVWKIEGLDDFEQFKAVVDEASRDTEKEVGVVVLGRGEKEEKVLEWINVAAQTPGIIGMAVGRTVFKQSLVDFAAGKITREEAAEQIAKNYKGFVEIFSAEGGSASGGEGTNKN